MAIVNWIAILGAGIIIVGFFLARANLFAFALASLSAICLPVLLDGVFSLDLPTNEKVVLVTALFLFATGLIFVRIILIRSVSLRLLVQQASESPTSTIEDDVAQRLEDAIRYRFARKEGPLYKLAVPGQITAATIAILYQLTGSR
jgi:hypothetical protein